MKKVLHICPIKKPCRIQVILGLCLAMLFTFILPSSFINATEQDGLYPIKISKVLSSNNVDRHIDQGFNYAKFTINEHIVEDGDDYVDYVLDCIDEALLRVPTYFSFSVPDNIYNRTYAYNVLHANLGSNFEDRNVFLNAYLVTNGLSFSVYFQINYGFQGFSSSFPFIESINNINYIRYHLFSSVTFFYPEYFNDIHNRDILTIPYDYFNGNSLNNSFNFYPCEANINNFNLYQPVNGSNTYLSGLVSNLSNYVNRNVFFTISSNDGIVKAYECINADYILPLYLDSDVYNEVSFFVPDVVSGDDIYSSYYLKNISNHDRFFIGYYPNNLNLNDYLSYFTSNYWYANNFISGIKSSMPDPILTPIPTFSPIYSPTPFPTLNIRATLTPIAIPNDPLINTGLGDPISVVYGVIGYLTQVLSLPHIKFISTTIEYVYNSNIFFQILMFLIPGIVLITFMIGRLKRK